MHFNLSSICVHGNWIVIIQRMSGSLLVLKSIKIVSWFAYNNKENTLYNCTLITNTIVLITYLYN